MAARENGGKDIELGSKESRGDFHGLWVLRRSKTPGSITHFLVSVNGDLCAPGDSVATGCATMVRSLPGSQVSGKILGNFAHGNGL